MSRTPCYALRCRRSCLLHCKPQAADAAGAYRTAAAPAACRPRRHSVRRSPPPISPRTCSTLASDEFEGRAPGSAGEDKTVAYLEAQFERLGLKPGNGDSYFQTVPMVETTADADTVRSSSTSTAQPRELKFGTDMVIGTRTGKPEVKIDGSELVFVGYGVNAPEQEWNDYAGVDVKGKTVVMLVNDPGFHAQDADAVRRQAHDLLRALDLQVRGGRAPGRRRRADHPRHRRRVLRLGRGEELLVGRAVRPAASRTIRRRACRCRAGSPATPRARCSPTPARTWTSCARPPASAASRRCRCKATRVARPEEHASREKASRNVIARLPGTKRPDEAIVYMAHWDHLGNHGHEGDEPMRPTARTTTSTTARSTTRPASPASSRSPRRSSTQQPPPERSLLFLAVTLEESGLLGSQVLRRPPERAAGQDRRGDQPRRDAGGRQGARHDRGRLRQLRSSRTSSSRSPTAQGRVLHAEATPENGFYFRSDHFNFAKAGVPALYAKGGDDLLEGGTDAGRGAPSDYRDTATTSPPTSSIRTGSSTA